MPTSIRLGQEDAYVLPQKLARLPAENTPDRIADRLHDARLIDGEHRIVRRGEHGPQPGLALAQGDLDSLSLGNLTSYFFVDPQEFSGTLLNANLQLVVCLA